MSWPAVRTRPVPRGEVGAVPLLAGCLAVLVAVPLLSVVACSILGWWHERDDAGPVREALRLISFVLAFSPVFSWAALPVAVPLAVTAARRGRAGWLVAALAGATVAPLAMLAATPLMGGPPSAAPLLATPVGALLGGAFWLGARWARPGLLAPP